MAFGAVVELSSLGGRNGFRITGEENLGFSGRSVASADVNGDGFSDVIIGSLQADGFTFTSGDSYVVFGGAGGRNVDLSSLNGRNGFQINGTASNSSSGHSVASAGDVNGDGVADFIIGASAAGRRGASYSSDSYGESYVVFGRTGDFAAEFDLSRLNGRNGFRLDGVAKGDRIGADVHSAGDVNGDGFADIIIGAPGADTRNQNAGAAYVVFGKAGGFGAALNLSALDGSNGFRFGGQAIYEGVGRSVATAGDINGDGFDDVVVGAGGYGLNGPTPGAAFVLFGKADGFAASLDPSFLNGTNGFRIGGSALADGTVSTVSSAGDVNGDGFADFIVAAPDAGGKGAAYVVFGRAQGFGSDLDLSALDGSNGFRIVGGTGNSLGSAASSAGDVNGDGLDDILIGANGANPNGTNSGSAYVVFGRTGGFDAALDVSGLNGRNGFRVDGQEAFDNAGRAVAAGDVNGDGFDDIVVGASGAGPDDNYGNRSNVGVTYVIFGQASGPIRRAGTDADEAFGGYGFNDALRGAGGADTLSGEGGNDGLFGGAGNDLLSGGAGRDRVQGNAGNDRLLGGDGADALAGGSGADVLTGGLGADTLSGGFGADTFVFGALAESRPGESDILRGFEAGRDRIALNRIDADPDAAGNQAFAFIGAAAFTGAGGEVRFEAANGDTLVLADTDGDRQADLRIVLDGSVALTAGDFIL